MLNIELTVDVEPEDLAELIGLGGGEHRSAPYTGTKGLMLAVLEEAIRSYLGSASRLRTQAEMWIASRQRLPFSFTVVCETLGLEPDSVRKALPILRVTYSRGTVRRRSRPNVHRYTRLSQKQRSSSG